MVALVSASIGISFATFWTKRTAGHSIAVSVNDEILFEAALAEPAEFNVDGIKGVSRVKVEDGRARFVDSICHGRYCIHAGWLSATGQVAACLPNGVVIEVLGGERAYDAINL